MGGLLILVMLIFVVLFVIAVPTVITDLKSQRQKNVEKEF
jgi:competence protein ComGC